MWCNTSHWKITALICCARRSPKVTLITVFVSIVAWKQARWPPLLLFLISPCPVTTAYQVSSEIYGGFFYYGITLRWLPIVFCPRARRFRKPRDGASFQTPRQSRAPDHAVKCRQTWRPNFYNLFIESVAWIGSGFKTFVGWIEDPGFPCLT